MKEALHKAFITLAEGEGYLLGQMPNASASVKIAHARVCALFAQTREQIEAALATPFPSANIHSRKLTQTDFFKDSEL